MKLLYKVMVISFAISNCGCEKGKKPVEPSKKEQQDKQRDGKRGERHKQVAVKAQIVSSQQMPQVVEMVTVLEGRKQAQVYSRVAGKVSFIGASEGSEIKEGEILFRVDRSDPGESFLATPVVSPIKGWVGRWLVTSIGSPVNAQQPVVTVVDDAFLRGRVQLPTAEWLLVSDSTPVRVTVGKDTRNAKVIGISRAAELSSSRGTISIEIDNADHKWKAGMVALVAFDLDSKERLVLPASALSITDQGSFVFIIKEGMAQRMPVRFAPIDNDQVEILEGLNNGMQVITLGVNQVGDGLAINIVDHDNKTKGR